MMVGENAGDVLARRFIEIGSMLEAEYRVREFAMLKPEELSHFASYIAGWFNGHNDKNRNSN